jgi:hypothetical protein
VNTPSLKINRTKEGITVTRGQVWKDRDLRMRGRLVVVLQVPGTGFAECVRCLEDGSHVGDRVVTLSIKRMHRHSTGWELVKDVEQGESPTGRVTISEPNIQTIPLHTPEAARVREAFVDRPPLVGLTDYP